MCEIKRQKKGNREKEDAELGQRQRKVDVGGNATNTHVAQMIAHMVAAGAKIVPQIRQVPLAHPELAVKIRPQLLLLKLLISVLYSTYRMFSKICFSNTLLDCRYDKFR